jgi:hypothetical protein
LAGEQAPDFANGFHPGRPSHRRPDIFDHLSTAQLDDDKVGPSAREPPYGIVRKWLQRDGPQEADMRPLVTHPMDDALGETSGDTKADEHDPGILEEMSFPPRFALLDGAKLRQ